MVSGRGCLSSELLVAAGAATRQRTFSRPPPARLANIHRTLVITPSSTVHCHAILGLSLFASRPAAPPLLPVARFPPLRLLVCSP